MPSLCFSHPRDGVIATRQHHRLDPANGQPVGKEIPRYLTTQRTPFVLHIAEGPGPGRYDAPEDLSMARPEVLQQRSLVGSRASSTESRSSAEPAATAGDTWNDDDDGDDDDDEEQEELESEHGSDSDEEEANVAAASGVALGREQEWTREELQKLWLKYDNNNSGQISLAEIKTCVEEQYPAFNNDQVLMRAYHFADADGSGLITRPEFTALLRALPHFTKLWRMFAEIDVNGDGSLDMDEFVNNKEKLGLEELTIKSAKKLFRKIDDDNSGTLRFFELCAHLAQRKAGADERREGRRVARAAALAAARRVLPWRQKDKRRRYGCGSSTNRRSRVLDAPIARTGRTPFATIKGVVPTLETVDSPGPCYDTTGSLVARQQSVARPANSRARDKGFTTFGAAPRFELGSKGGQDGGDGLKRVADSPLLLQQPGLDGPGPGKYNSRDFQYRLDKGDKEGGAAVLHSGEPRTMLSDNSRRWWGASKFSTGAFFPPDTDAGGSGSGGGYFTAPSAHDAGHGFGSGNIVGSCDSAVGGSTLRGTSSVDTALLGMSGASASFEFPRAKRSTNPGGGSEDDGERGERGGDQQQHESLLDASFTTFVLSNMRNAPAMSFGSASKQSESSSSSSTSSSSASSSSSSSSSSDRGGPGPRFNTTAGSLSSVGNSMEQRLPGCGGPSYSFGGGGGRESAPVVDERSNAIFGPSYPAPSSEREAAEAARRGAARVPASQFPRPGPADYTVDQLEARLDAALAFNRNQRFLASVAKPGRREDLILAAEVRAAQEEAAAAASTTQGGDGGEKRQKKGTIGGAAVAWRGQALAVEKAAASMASLLEDGGLCGAKYTVRSVPLAAVQHPSAPAFSFGQTGRAERARLQFLGGGDQFLEVGVFSPGPCHRNAPCAAFPARSFGTAADKRHGEFSFGGIGVAADRLDRLDGGISQAALQASASRSVNAGFAPTWTDTIADSAESRRLLDSVGNRQPSASPFKNAAVFSIGNATRTATAVNGMRSKASRMDQEGVYADYKKVQASKHRPAVRGVISGTSVTSEEIEAVRQPVTGALGRASEKQGVKKDEAERRGLAALKRFASNPRPGKGAGAKSDMLFPRESPGPARYAAGSLQEGVKASMTRARRFTADKRGDGSVIEHPLYREGTVRIQGSKGGPQKKEKKKKKKKKR